MSSSSQLSPRQQQVPHKQFLSVQVFSSETNKSSPNVTSLRAGPLSLLYEDGGLRYIKLGQHEVVRRIYVAVRDSIWRTITPRFSEVRLNVDDDAFNITYEVENVERDIKFAWQAEISGDSSGTIVFRMKGVARSTFKRSRIGFCVLHPMHECAGARCTVVQDDGRMLQSSFPRWIVSYAPFMEMQSISHEVIPGVWADLSFEGDLFEMEDQRNWTDASFKTFCTPLRLPYPVEIREGTSVEQAVRLSLHRDLSLQRELSHQGERANELASVGRLKRPLSITIEPSEGNPLATIGLGMASHGSPLTGREVMHLCRLNLSHLRVDLQLNQPDWHATLERATVDANRLGIPLEAALFVSDDAEKELAELVTILRRIQPFICRWLIFHVEQPSTKEPWISLARQSLATFGSSIPLGSGTNVYFAQLNRGKPPMSLVDVACYSINPQAHAFDNRSLVETLEAQGTTVENARRFVGHVPLEITPITLRPRFNTKLGYDPEVPAGELPFSVDPRQASLFGAVWTLGSLKYMNESRVDSLTYYETTGWRGVMESESGSMLPGKFHSFPGSIFPLYHVLADFGEFSSGKVIPCRSSEPLHMDAMVLKKRGATRMLVANMTNRLKEAIVDAPVDRVQIKYLDETNVMDAMMSSDQYRLANGSQLLTRNGKLTISLRPFALARIDWREELE